MDHRAVRQRLSEYIDDAITDEERMAVEAHLRSCAACSGALAELKKSIGHVKKIEPLEPPPWLASRIMAHVREEAEKRGSWRRFFSPAVLRPAMSAVAIAFVALIAFSIYEVSRPQLALEEAPVLPQQRVLAKPGPESPKMAAPVMEKRAMEFEAKAVAEGAAQAPAAPEPPPPAPAAVSPAPAMPSTLGVAERAEERAAEAPVFPGLAKKAPTLRFAVKVADPKAASEEIKRAIAGLGGEVVASHPLGNKEIVRARIDASKLEAFSRTLGRLGQIVARPPTGEKRKGIIALQITLFPQ